MPSAMSLSLGGCPFICLLATTAHTYNYLLTSWKLTYPSLTLVSVVLFFCYKSVQSVVLVLEVVVHEEESCSASRWRSGQAGGVFTRQAFWALPKKTPVGQSGRKRLSAGKSASSGSDPLEERTRDETSLVRKDCEDFDQNYLKP